MSAALLALASCGNSTTNSATSTQTANQLANTSTKTSSHVTFGTGKAHIQLFSDFQCPGCQNAEKTTLPVLEKLAEAGKLTIEYYQYPLTKIHQNAFKDANAALCAADQGVYQQFSKAMFALELSKAGANVTDNERIALLKDLDIDHNKYAQCVTNEENKSLVEADIRLGDSLAIKGTPTFLLEGKDLPLGAFSPKDTTNKSADQQIVEFQQNLEKFLNEYTEKISGAEPTITSETGSTSDNGVGGVVAQ